MIRVLIAGPHPMFQEGLARLLAETGDIELVSGVGNVEATLRAVVGAAIDVAVIETELLSEAGGEPAGIDTVERIRALQASTRCVALSVRGSRRELEKALAAGASAFVTRAGSSGELIEAIRAVHAGRWYVSPSVTEGLVVTLGKRSEPGATGLAGLTAREQEVLELIASGFSSPEIAKRLGVSTRTVDSHRARLMSKLGLRKTAGLVRFAVREGLIAA
ncbi:MAG: response regulator transcription factor [Myxococcota bacterium]|nr:response regulator transcription factor [Myxococcota bacterium]